MKILLELPDWQKTIEVDPWIANKEYIKVALYPPVQCLCSPEDLTSALMSSVNFVRFFYTGQVTDKTGLRIFRYDG